MMNDVILLIFGFFILFCLLIGTGLLGYRSYDISAKRLSKNNQKRWILRLFGLDPINGKISVGLLFWQILAWCFLIGGTLVSLLFGKSGAKFAGYLGIIILGVVIIVGFLITTYKEKV